VQCGGGTTAQRCNGTQGAKRRSSAQRKRCKGVMAQRHNGETAKED